MVFIRQSFQENTEEVMSGKNFRISKFYVPLPIENSI